MKSTGKQLQTARDAFDRSAWRAAYEGLAACTGELGSGDLSRLAISAYLLGRETDFVRAMQLAHQAQVDADEPDEASRSAFWLGFHFVTRGDVAQASGWFGRAARLLEGKEEETPGRGYLLVPTAFQKMAADPEAAADAAGRAVAIGRRQRDADLLALALHIEGRALLRLERIDEGLALLDEAMVSVAAGEVSPHVTGLVYCSVIGACREVWDVRRVQEWTGALADWCDRQPDMVPYSGECRVYRSEVLHLHGKWPDALGEARRAAEHLASGRQPRLAAIAHYQQGEVLRLRGELASAEEAYRAASRLGREPQPGLALLRLAQGDKEAAAASVRRALAETRGQLERARLLPAHIQIMIEAGALEEARRSLAELSEAVRCCASGLPETLLAEATGAIELAAGDPAAALAPLRRACRDWEALDAPYNAARVRVLIGRACKELGDEDGAALELEAARAEFERLGASPDAARVDALTERGSARDAHGLTAREREVLALLATGRTNRAIATGLFISEKTVARHVANIFTKLGVPSRAAATAYAYKHGLIGPST